MMTSYATLLLRRHGDRLDPQGQEFPGFIHDGAKRMFRLFHRLNALAEREGTGVGLSIARKIVERHGGSIGVTPAEGGGSVFRFTLPIA